MTQEDIKAIESLTNELKELNRTLNVLAAAHYAEIKLKGEIPVPTSGKIKAKMMDGLRVVDELKRESSSVI